MDESDDVGIDVPFISWLNRREILNTTTCDEDCVNEHMILEVIPTSLKNIHGGQLTSVCTILGDSRTGKCVVVDPGTDEPDMIIDIINTIISIIPYPSRHSPGKCICNYIWVTFFCFF